MSAVFKYLDLSALPEAWTADHFGNLVNFKLGKTPPRSDAVYWKEGKYPWVSISDMTPYGVVNDTAEKVSQKAHDTVFGGRLVPEGSLLMSFKLTIGRMSRLGVAAFHNEAIISFQPNPEKVCPDYLSYYLSQINYKDYQDTAIKGQTLNKGKLNALEIVLPPLPEQKKIAHILSTVQRAIEAQERIIQTTTELKKALMHKLFTEGLRGEPQKQTEIGPIPESWELAPIGELFDTQLGKMLSQKAKVGNAPKPYLRNKNVQWGRIETDDLLLMDFNDREAEKFLLRDGDLLVCEGGEVGRAAIWRGQIVECYYQKALHRLRPISDRITNEYMAHWMMFAFLLTNTYGVTGTRTTIAHLPEIKLKPLLVPIPKRAEMDEIVRALDSSDQKIENHREKHSQLQDLFRTLLHELMTAKTRVHELSIPATS